MKNWTTLKKLIWLKATILSGVAAIVKTVTGNAPITLTNAVARAIHSLTQTGKCTQASTPTPTSPVDIYCNNGVVKYGALGTNLLNAETDIVGAYLNADGEPVAGGSNYRYSDIIPVKAGKYVFSGTANPTSGQTKRVHGYANGVWQSQLAATYVAKDTEFSVSITVPSGVNGIRVSYYTGDVDAQVTKGSTVPPYAPYVGGIYVDGTPEVLTVRTNNLVDVAHLTPVNLAYSTNKLVTNTARYGYYIPVKPNTKYTVSINRDKTNAYLNICESASEPANNVAVTNYTSMGGETASKTITMKSTTNWLYVYAGFPATPDPFTQGDFQIEEGNTATPYAPYHRETASVVDLLSVGDYADTQEIISGAVTRNVGIKVFDGTENWTRTASGDGCTVFSIVANAHSIPGWSKITSLSTNFECYVGSTSPTYIAANAGKFWLNTAGQYFRFVIEGTMGLAQFKAWLAAQYAAGTPVIVLYPLAEATTESVAGQSLSTAAGTNVVSVNAEVSPVALECEYYATE